LKNRSWASFRFSFLSDYVNDATTAKRTVSGSWLENVQRATQLSAQQWQLARGNWQEANGKHPADRDNSHWPVARCKLQPGVDQT